MMLRSDIIQGTEKLKAVLKDSNLEEILEKLTHEQNKVDPAILLECYTKLIKASERFGDVERELISVFKMDPLFEYDFWGYLIKNEASPRIVGKFHNCRSGTLFFLNYAPQVEELLRRPYDESLDEDEEEEFEKLTVYLYEDSLFSTPARLSNALDAVDGFYSVFSELDGGDVEALRVVACDSGSDKVFDFVGNSKVVGEVKDLVIHLWDKIVYYRGDKAGKRLDLISQDLPVLERINMQLLEDAIEPERVELLRRKINVSVEQFITSGATIAEIASEAYQEPRILMQPEMKFLAPPADMEDILEGVSPMPAPDYTHEEEAESEAEEAQEDADNLDYQAYMPKDEEVEEKEEPQYESYSSHTEV